MYKYLDEDLNCLYLNLCADELETSLRSTKLDEENILATWFNNKNIAFLVKILQTLLAYSQKS